MKCKTTRTSRAATIKVLVVGIICIGIMGALWQGTEKSEASQATDIVARLYQKPAPNFDLNESRALPDDRVASGDQLAALANLRTAVNAPNMTVRWSNFGGSRRWSGEITMAPPPCSVLIAIQWAVPCMKGHAGRQRVVPPPAMTRSPMDSGVSSGVTPPAIAEKRMSSFRHMTPLGIPVVPPV